MCVASVIVKRPALPQCTVDRRSRNHIYHYYHGGGGSDGECVLLELL